MFRRILKSVVFAAVLAVSALSSTSPPKAEASYSGSNGIWAMKKNDYVATNFAGDSVGLRLAIGYASTGGHVQISAGQLLVGSPILVTSGVTVAGTSDSTRLVNVGNNDIFWVTGSNAHIKNLTIDGQKAIRTSGRGVLVTGANCSVEGCTIRNTPNAAIALTSTALSFRAITNTIDGFGLLSGSTSPFGIDINGADSVLINDQVIRNGYGPGVALRGGAMDVRITNSRISANQNLNAAYWCSGVWADSSAKRLNVSSSAFNDMLWAFDVDADSSTLGPSNLIDNCKAWHTDGSNGVKFTGNMILGHKKPGGSIFFEAWPESDADIINPEVTNNTFIDVGHALHGECNAGNTCSGLKWEGNTILGCNDNASAVRLLCVAGGSWDKNRIANNLIVGPKKSGVQLYWSGSTATTKRISKTDVVGNTIIDPGEYGVQTGEMSLADSSSNAFISGNIVRNPGLGDYDLSQTNWTYTAKAGVRMQASTLVVDDVAEIADSLTSASTFVSKGAAYFGGAVAGGNGATSPLIYSDKTLALGSATSGQASKNVDIVSNFTGTSAFTNLSLNGLHAINRYGSGGSGGGDMATGMAIGAYSEHRGGAAITGALYGSENATTMYNTGSVVTAFGSLNTAQVTTGANASITTAIGSRGIARFYSGTGTITTAYGVSGIAGTENSSTGTITDAFGGRFEIEKSGGTITNATGLVVPAITQGSNNNFGVRISGAASGGGNLNQSLRVDAGDSYFGGKLIAADSLRANKKVVADLGLNVTGSSWISGATDIGNKLTVKDSVIVDGSGSAGYVRAGGNVESSGGHLVAKTTIDLRNTASNSANPVIFRQSATDALEFRTPGSSSPGYYFKGFGGSTIGGPLWAAGPVTATDSVTAEGSLVGKTKATITDSLNVIGVLTVGQKSGIPQRSVFGNGGTTAADTVTLLLNGPSASGIYTPKIELQRAGTPDFSLSTNGASTYLRWTQGEQLKVADLGSNTPWMVLDHTSGVPGGQIGGTGTPTHTWDVHGTSVIDDSLRANKGIYVGGPLVQAIYSATATLDFPSGTTDDLTISVGGAAVGDPVIVGVPNGSVSTTASFSGWVSSSGTVTVRCKRAATEDPASGTFRATVLHY